MDILQGYSQPHCTTVLCSIAFTAKHGDLTNDKQTHGQALSPTAKTPELHTGHLGSKAQLPLTHPTEHCFLLTQIPGAALLAQVAGFLPPCGPPGLGSQPYLSPGVAKWFPASPGPCPAGLLLLSLYPEVRFLKGFLKQRLAHWLNWLILQL